MTLDYDDRVDCHCFYQESDDGKDPVLVPSIDCHLHWQDVPNEYADDGADPE